MPSLYTYTEARPGCSCTNATRELYSHQDTKLYFSRNFSSARVMSSTRREPGAGPGPPAPSASPSCGGPMPTPAPQLGTGWELTREGHVGVQESSWGWGPTPSANSRLHHLVPSSAGDRSPVPSAVAAGAMRFHALHTEDLNSVFPGRGTGVLGVGRGEQSQQHRQQGEQPHGQGEESAQS